MSLLVTCVSEYERASRNNNIDCRMKIHYRERISPNVEVMFGKQLEQLHSVHLKSICNFYRVMIVQLHVDLYLQPVISAF